MSNVIMGGVATMSSREIAGLTGKRHAHVMDDCRKLSTFYIKTYSAEKSAEHVNPSAYVDSTGRSLPCFHLSKQASLDLVTGYSLPHRHAVNVRWQELEAGQTAKHPAEMSRLEILQLAIESEQGRLQAVTERDEAIRTKAEIGSRREATAMATASAAIRKVKKLEGELGWGAEYGTVIAVAKAAGVKFPRNVYVALRKWCEHHGVSAKDVPDKRYGQVKAWPAGAWMELHGIDLEELFPQRRERLIQEG